MKVKLLALTLAVLMTVCLFTGCKDNTNTGTSTDTTSIPETSAPITTEAPDTDYTGVYDDLLFEIYKHILAITYDAENSDSMDGDAGFREVVGSLSEEDALRAIGYTEHDINNDGIPELLIYLIDDNGNEKCAGTRILTAYTVVDNSPVLIFEGTSRNRYFLLSDGTIYNEGSNGAAYVIFGTYTLEAGAQNLTPKDYYFTSDSGADHTIEFYQNTTADFDIEKSEKFTEGEDAFWQIQADLSKKIAESELKPFEVFSAGDGTEEVSCVIAVFAEDTLVELTNAERFTADNSEYQTEVVFFANYGDVYDFEFCEIKWLDDSDGGESDIEFVPVYKTETLTQDTPLVVTMTFWGDIPSYGIIYTDSEGVEHSGSISTSGMDGSLILDVI